MKLEQILYTNDIREIPAHMKQNILVITTDNAFAEKLTKQGIAVALDETGEEAERTGKGNKEGTDTVFSEKKFSCAYVVTHPEELTFLDFDRIYRRQKQLPWTILSTDRCILREFCMEDLEDLLDLYRQPGITDYLEPLGSPEEEARYQREYIRHMYGFFEYGLWIVTDRATGKMIGRAGIETNDRCGAGEVELGYVIHPCWQNRGIATEVCSAILGYAREELGISHVFVRVHRENKASVSLAEKLGVEIRFL